MHIRPCSPDDLLAVYQLLTTTGWEHRIGSLHQLQQLVDASQQAWVAQHDGAVLGFARAITDGLSNGYLSMVVVHPQHRGQGMGRALVEAVVGGNDQITWVLRAGRDGARDFFARLGFAPSTDAMERRRAAPQT
jgi:N-acetylglutamate synthase-like GNAT family acetyltransferase